MSFIIDNISALLISIIGAILLALIFEVSWFLGGQIPIIGIIFTIPVVEDIINVVLPSCAAAYIFRNVASENCLPAGIILSIVIFAWTALHSLDFISVVFLANGVLTKLIAIIQLGFIWAIVLAAMVAINEE